MDYTCELRELSPQPAAVIRATAAPEELGSVFADILPATMAFLEARGVAPAGPPFVRYLSMEGGKFEIEGGMATATPVDPEGRVVAIELPGGEAVTTVHVGPYQEIGAAHSAIGEWMAANGRASGGPPWEVYVTDPGETPNPSSWRSEVFMPLA